MYCLLYSKMYNNKCVSNCLFAISKNILYRVSRQIKEKFCLYFSINCGAQHKKHNALSLNVVSVHVRHTACGVESAVAVCLLIGNQVKLRFKLAKSWLVIFKTNRRLECRSSRHNNYFCLPRQPIARRNFLLIFLGTHCFGIVLEPSVL